MANYFTQFSVALRLPNEAAQTYALDLAHQASQGQMGNELPADFPEALAKVIDDWLFETEANSSAGEHGLWLHSSDGGVDALCAFIQHLLQMFQPDGRVGFAWSYDCSKPRLDAYGGGAAVVTALEIRSIETGQWLRENKATPAV